MTLTTEQQPSGKHPDRAVSIREEDHYGFTHIATQLALSIQGIGREGSAVIGIEGAWGTGKTSLLNLLSMELDKQKEARTFVLRIFPLARWQRQQSGGVVTTAGRRHHCCRRREPAFS